MAIGMKNVYKQLYCLRIKICINRMGSSGRLEYFMRIAADANSDAQT